MTTLSREYQGVRKLRIWLTADWNGTLDEVKYLFGNITLTPGFQHMCFEPSTSKRPFEIEADSYILSANDHDCRSKKWKSGKIKTPSDFFMKLKKECKFGGILKLKVIRDYSHSFDKHYDPIRVSSYFI